MIKILIIEDDYRVADIHASYVNAVPGFTVAGVVHTIREANSFLSAIKVDLILLDIYLPDGTGLEFIQSLQNDKKVQRADIFVISAARDSATLKSALSLGAVNYIVKPFTPNMLAERLTSYLRAVRQLSLDRDVSQADVDRVAALMRGASTKSAHDESENPTAESIIAFLQHQNESLSAVEIAEAVGISRATAQRYLSQLVERRIVKLDLKYGLAGRPIHNYKLVR